MINYDIVIEPGDVIAVGDIHARYDLFEEFLNHVRGSLATVILLGDIIDRGGQDIEVLNKVRALLENPESEGLSNFFCLMGNHEAMFVDALVGPGPDFVLWLQNGGNFECYGEMQGHLDWLSELPVYMTIGETMFIHAGFYPGKNPLDTINAGKTDNILWMREPFLTIGPQFEKWNPDLKKVVFGHTPKYDCPEEGKPYEIPDGICIDTGACYTGVLTAYNATRNTVSQYRCEGYK
jgi:serine/threonine protein phosphatase 1